MKRLNPVRGSRAIVKGKNVQGWNHAREVFHRILEGAVIVWTGKYGLGGGKIFFCLEDPSERPTRFELQTGQYTWIRDEG